MSAETTERLPLLRPDDLREEQRQVYEAVVAGPRADESAFDIVDDAGRLLGPYNAMLHSPAVGMSLQGLGAAVRFATSFTPREREIAILVVAARWRSDYAWFAHERAGRLAGLTSQELDALRIGGNPMLVDARERAVHEAALALTQAADLDDALYAESTSTLGQARLVELVTLVGYYATLSLQMRVFRVGVPRGESIPPWE